MRAMCAGLACLIILPLSSAYGGGFAFNDDLTVLAPNQELATWVLTQATSLRRDIAKEWLGEELPTGLGETGVHLVRLSETEDRAHTWLKSGPKQTLHRIWITAPRRGVVPLLGHELAHTILATKFPGLPVWAQEAIACRYDDAERKEIRCEIIRECVQTKDWPRVGKLLTATSIPEPDQTSYALAVSIRDYLLSIRNDRPAFVRFASAGKEKGWDFALQEYYGLRSISDMQAGWQRWAQRTRHPVAGLASRPARSLSRGW